MKEKEEEININLEDKNFKEKKDLSKLLLSNLSDLRLACPQCGLIPAIFNDMKAKNIYQISSSCENKHLLSCIPVKDYYKRCMNLKNSSKSKLNDFICINHNSNYNSFCKTCQKNICKECSDTEHKSHFISQFYELLPSNEEIIQLKNSIENEINDVSVFLCEMFNKWINELQRKFDKLIENIKCKNKLYEFIINFYETKEFNYQNIYNIKIISQNQLKKNPLTQEIQTLKNIMLREESDVKINKDKNKDNKELKEDFFKIKSSQILKILETLKIDYNPNYSFISSESSSASKILSNFLNDKKQPSTEDDFVIINSYNQNESNSNNIIYGDNEESKLKLKEKMEIIKEIKLDKRKLNEKIDLGKIVNSLTVLKDLNGTKINKFAAGLDDGRINIYYVDPKCDKIYLDFEINEHTKSVLYITCLNDGRILSCSQDGTMKIFEETNSYLLSFWKRYYLIQTLIRPNNDIYDQFQPVCAVEMNKNTLVTGDWKHIIIWKLKKNENKKKEDYGFNINDYYKDRYSYLYEIFKEININASVTALLKIDDRNFVSAHYGPSTLTFYNIYDNSYKTINKIRCVDSATQCMTLIEVKKAGNNWEKEKIIVVGGYKCVYCLSVKQQNLIDKISIPGNNYIKCLVNSGIQYISNGFICGGLFNQYDHDIVHYNSKTQLGFSELVINEISRIQEVDRGAINSLIILKKNIYDNSCEQNNVVVITGGNEGLIKTYNEKDEE